MPQYDHRSNGQSEYWTIVIFKKTEYIVFADPKLFFGVLRSAVDGRKNYFLVSFAFSIFKVNCTSGICEIEMLLCVGTFGFFCVFCEYILGGISLVFAFRIFQKHLLPSRKSKINCFAVKP